MIAERRGLGQKLRRLVETRTSLQQVVKYLDWRSDQRNKILLTCFAIDGVGWIVMGTVLRIVVGIVLRNVIVVFLHHVHIAQKTWDRHVADGFLEEQHLNCCRADGSERWKQQQKSTEARWLTGVTDAHVIRENALRLVLQHLNRLDVAKSSCFWLEKKTIMLLQPNQYVCWCLSPGANKMTAFMHPTSLESGESCRNRHRISWTVFISMHVAGSSGILSRTCGLSNSVAKSHGTLHCAKFSKNSSFHDSCSSNCWSGFESVWNGTRHRTHLTAMNKRRAVVSYLD